MVAGIVVPIYEYQCQSCREVFEYMQRMSEDPKTECETCQGKLERLISQSAFHLKGGGWYKDLYSSTKKDDKGTTSSPKASESSGSSTASEPSKPSSEASKSTAEPSTPKKKTASSD